MEKQNFSGSCLCGAVQYNIKGSPVRFYHCHCARCRKVSGTGHATNIMIQANKVDWLKGESEITRYKVPEAERFTNAFCQTCGSRLPRFDDVLGMVILPAGSLEVDISIKPEARIFWDSRAEWSCSGDDLPVYAEYVTE